MTVDEYLAALPDDRREALTAVRQTILANLEPGFEEALQYGMPSYRIPIERYPDTYNGQPLTIASFASQKRHMALYLNCVYSDDEEATRFRDAWTASGKRLDMGKSCVRFRQLDDVALDVLAGTIARTSVNGFIAAYERARS
jgi:uncharacterized protein YdhG (YjbR/CyaY superfamily)